MTLSPFHLAIAVKEITETRAFYRDVIGCSEGRSSEQWVDFNFYGHQLVIHISENIQASNTNLVDGHNVPVPHFGIVLPWGRWKELSLRIREAGIKFIVEPYIRFEGEVGEQATMFFQDPSGNNLEFKAFRDRSQLFAK